MLRLPNQIPLLAALISAGLWLAVNPAQAAEVNSLTPFEADYKVRFKGLRGTMTQSLEKTNDDYIARSELKPRGLASILAGGAIQESTVFTIGDARVVSNTYTMTDTISKKDKFASLDFDWVGGRATGRTEKGPVAHDIDSSTYDRASIQYALMLDLLNERSSTAYTMLDRHRRKSLTITDLGERVIEVPFGRYSVRVISHQAEGSSRMTTLYCAPVLGYLPVQIEQFKDGKRQVRAQLTDYTAHEAD